MQAVLKAPKLESRYIKGEQDAVREYARIRNHEYDIVRGDTMIIALLPLLENVDQLIIGYGRKQLSGHHQRLTATVRQQESTSCSYATPRFLDYAAQGIL